MTGPSQQNRRIEEEALSPPLDYSSWIALNEDKKYNVRDHRSEGKSANAGDMSPLPLKALGAVNDYAQRKQLAIEPVQGYDIYSSILTASPSEKSEIVASPSGETISNNQYQGFYYYYYPVSAHPITISPVEEEQRVQVNQPRNVRKKKKRPQNKKRHKRKLPKKRRNRNTIQSILRRKNRKNKTQGKYRQNKKKNLNRSKKFRKQPRRQLQKQKRITTKKKQKQNLSKRTKVTEKRRQMKKKHLKRKFHPNNNRRKNRNINLLTRGQKHPLQLKALGSAQVSLVAPNEGATQSTTTSTTTPQSTFSTTTTTSTTWTTQSTTTTTTTTFTTTRSMRTTSRPTAPPGSTFKKEPQQSVNEELNLPPGFDINTLEELLSPGVLPAGIRLSDLDLAPHIPEGVNLLDLSPEQLDDVVRRAVIVFQGGTTVPRSSSTTTAFEGRLKLIVKFISPLKAIAKFSTVWISAN